MQCACLLVKPCVLTTDASLHQSSLNILSIFISVALVVLSISISGALVVCPHLAADRRPLIHRDWADRAANSDHDQIDGPTAEQLQVPAPRSATQLVRHRRPSARPVVSRQRVQSSVVSTSAVSSPLSTVHRQPSTVHRPPSTVHRPPSTVHRPPSTVQSSNGQRLPSDRYQPFTVQLSGVRTSLPSRQHVTPESSARHSLVVSGRCGCSVAVQIGFQQQLQQQLSRSS